MRRIGILLTLKAARLLVFAAWVLRKAGMRAEGDTLAGIAKGLATKVLGKTLI